MQYDPVNKHCCTRLENLLGCFFNEIRFKYSQVILSKVCGIQFISSCFTVGDELPADWKAESVE
jgi:hypothetical protein